MASKIEWTDETWNPVVGCQIVSPGCTNCYAMKMAGRLQAMGTAPHYVGTVRKTKAGFVWTGTVVEAPHHIMCLPFAWRAPRLVFVNSMSDLFHESVSFGAIDRVFAVMAVNPQHQYQVLTKRADRMRDYIASRTPTEHLRAWSEAFAPGALPMTKNEVQARLLPDATTEHRALHRVKAQSCPLPNVWLGASVEDQVRADQRRNPMAEVAAAGWNTFVSYEPALGEVDWSGWEFLKWLIAGGESGRDARPVHPDWIRIARNFCADHAILFFFKQWGEWAPGEANSFRKTLAVRGAYHDGDGWRLVRLSAAEGAEMHCDDEPDVWRIGKRHSGRLLDGVEHNGMPEVTRG